MAARMTRRVAVRAALGGSWSRRVAFAAALRYCWAGPGREE